MDSEQRLSIAEIIDALPATDRAVLSEQYATWYNQLVGQYKQDFGLADDDDCKRKFTEEDQVIVFFRDALLWWYRHKPTITDVLTPLDALKTRTCLGQIMSLERRLDETGIALRKLNLNDHLSKRDLDASAEQPQPDE